MKVNKDTSETLFMPSTDLGKWSVGLIIIAFLVYVLYAKRYISVGGGPISRFFLPAGSFFTGLIAIGIKKERSPLVAAAVVISFFTLFVLFAFTGMVM
ncbi:MAG: hypothetical protein V5A57_02230 [Candidatus Paceibacterota bacterium]